MRFDDDKFAFEEEPWGEETTDANEELSDLNADLCDTDQAVQLSDWIDGKVIATLPNKKIGPIREREYYRYMVVPCHEGDLFKISAGGSGKSVVRVYAFTASDGMIIKRGLYTDYVNKVIAAPPYAARLYINDKYKEGSCCKIVKSSAGAGSKPAKSSEAAYEKTVKSSEAASRKNEKYVKILCIGNSFTSDSTTYVPALLENIAGVKIVMAKTYYSGARISQYINWFDDDSAVLSYHKYAPEASRWSNGQSNQTLKNILRDEPWDVITFSPGSGDVKSGTPSKLNALIYKVSKYCASVHGKGLKIGWLMPQMRPPEERKTVTYEDCISMVKAILNETAVDFMIPCITAIENARGTSLNDLGDYGSLARDDIGHLQAGIPALISCYTTALSILELLGEKYHGILQNKLRPTDEWIESQNAFHHGSSVGVNDKNCYIAQKCAIAAMKTPYKISPISEDEIEESWLG